MGVVHKKHYESIRNAYNTRQHTQVELAKIYATSNYTISRIINADVTPIDDSDILQSIFEHKVNKDLLISALRTEIKILQANIEKLTTIPRTWCS